MKKTLLSMFLFMGTGFFINSFSQTQKANVQLQVTRTVYIYIIGLDNSAESAAVEQYFEAFKGKIESAEADETNQMCVVKVNHLTDVDLIEILDQIGFQGLIKEEMPPAGQRYIYNPDGTWKIKNI